MKVINKLDDCVIREVDFPKGKVVDLSDNPALFEKVLNIPGFEEPKQKKKTNVRKNQD